MKIAIIGCNGFIARALIAQLCQTRADLSIHLVARSIDISHYPGDNFVFFEGDAHDPALLKQALSDVDVAYYLIHGLKNRKAYHQDPKNALVFAQVAAHCQLQHIVYVGVLGVEQGESTPHISGRCQVGRALASTKVPVTELCCAVVVGRGSAVIELFRTIIQQPFIPLILPQGSHSLVQPIALTDLINCLVQYGCAANPPLSTHSIVEVAGSEVVSWQELLELMMEIMAKKRVVVVMPIAIPLFSGFCMRVFGSFSIAMGASFVKGLKYDVVLSNSSSSFVQPTSLYDALYQALNTENE